MPQEPSGAELDGWEAWLSERPAAVQSVARNYPPWRLYKLNGGNLVRLLSYDEQVGGGVTVTARVSQQFNPDVLFERDVFGIGPENLEEFQEE